MEDARDARGVDEVERRIDALEKRVERIEGLLSAAPQRPAAEPASPPTPAPGTVPAQPIASAWAAHATRAAGGRESRTSSAPGFSLTSLDSLATGRLLAWGGAAALLLAAAFFLSLAFSRGWIGPPARVAIAVVVGAALFAVGVRWLPTRLPLGHALASVGVAIVSLAIFAATRLFGLVPPPIGLAAAAVLALIAGWVALRIGSQLVALYGLAPLLAAPLLVDAPPDPLTFALVGAAIAVAAALAGSRRWPWLIPLAFLLVAPQIAGWIGGDPERPLAAGVVTLVWALLAGGAVAADRPDPRETAATDEETGEQQLLGPVAMLPVYGIAWLWALLAVIRPDETALRVAAVAAVGAAHVGTVALAVRVGASRAATWAIVGVGATVGVGALVVTPGMIAVVVLAAVAVAAAAAIHVERPRLAWFDDDAIVVAGVAVVAIAAGAAHALADVAPPSRLTVTGASDPVPVAAQGLVAFGALAIALLVIARWVTPRVAPAWQDGALLAALGSLLYGLSVVVIAPFEAVAIGVGPDWIRDAAQAALSLVWAVLGGLALFVGLGRDLRLARIAGLALLAAATVKVFVVDLAALDVAYRVLSFAGLGVLLLGAAYLYHRRDRARAPDAAGDPQPLDLPANEPPASG